MNFRYYFTISKLVFIIATPIILLFLPAGFFDGGESICLSKLLLGRECPACGMTRACMHLIHFDFEEAYAYNMMSFIALPLLAVVWIQWGLKEFRILKKINKKRAELAGLKPEA
jgi:hypothetical protein